MARYIYFYNQCLNASRIKGYTSVNFITIGIGGSFEGPKLLLESLNSQIEENTNKIYNPPRFDGENLKPGFFSEIK